MGNKNEMFPTSEKKRIEAYIAARPLTIRQ